MTWLEVPDWRAWESYAAPMTDTSDIPPALIELGFIAPEGDELDPAVVADSEAGSPPEPIVITGTMHIVLEDADVLEPAPELLDLDVQPEFPSEAPPEEPPVEELLPAAELVGPEPERITEPFVTPPSAPTSHEPPFESIDAFARRKSKESMSRNERLRRGW
jgi:hypothetical protein